MSVVFDCIRDVFCRISFALSSIEHENQLAEFYNPGTDDSRSTQDVYKTWAGPWPGPWPTLWPTLWPTQNFAVFTKIARSRKFSQNLVKRGMEPAEDCVNRT